MKKFFVPGLLLLAGLPGLACDQCGCGLLLGVQPKDHANNFGFQYRMRYLSGDLMEASEPLSLLKHGGHDETPADQGTARYVETYQVLEARGQVWLGQRASITASIPLLHNFQSVDGQRHADLYALGDPMLLVRYALFASLSGPDTTRLRHRFTMGVGMKLPLGRTDRVQYGETLDHDLQPGTGTWDPLVSIEYMVRGRVWGTGLSAVGRYNGEMADGFRMGHSTSFTAEVFRTFAAKDATWLPSAGAYVEAALPDEMHGEAQEGTGGNILFSHLGIRFWRKTLGLSLAWQHAVMNHMGAAMVPNRDRLMAGITYTFDKD